MLFRSCFQFSVESECSFDLLDLLFLLCMYHFGNSMFFVVFVCFPCLVFVPVLISASILVLLITLLQKSNHLLRLFNILYTNSITPLCCFSKSSSNCYIYDITFWMKTNHSNFSVLHFLICFNIMTFLEGFERTYGAVLITQNRSKSFLNYNFHYEGYLSLDSAKPVNYHTQNNRPVRTGLLLNLMKVCCLHMVRVFINRKPSITSIMEILTLQGFSQKTFNQTKGILYCLIYIDAEKALKVVFKTSIDNLTKICTKS